MPGRQSEDCCPGIAVQRRFKREILGLQAPGRARGNAKPCAHPRHGRLRRRDGQAGRRGAVRRGELYKPERLRRVQPQPEAHARRAARPGRAPERLRRGGHRPGLRDKPHGRLPRRAESAHLQARGGAADTGGGRHHRDGGQGQEDSPPHDNRGQHVPPRGVRLERAHTRRGVRRLGRDQRAGVQPRHGSGQRPRGGRGGHEHVLRDRGDDRRRAHPGPAARPRRRWDRRYSTTSGTASRSR